MKRLFIILLLWAAGLGAAGQFAKFTVIFPRLNEYAPTNPVLVGLLFSIISFIGLIFGLYAGIALPRWGSRRVLINMLVFGGVISFYQASFPALWIMFLLRVAEGASHLAIVVAAPTLVAQIATDRERPLAMTLWSTFFGVAFAAVYFLGRPFVANFGDASILYVHAIWMFAVSIFLVLSLPRDQSRETTQTPNYLREHVDAFTQFQSTIPSYGWLFYTLTYVSFISLLPSLLEENDKGYIVVAPLIGIASALILGGFFLTRRPAIQVVLVGFIGGLLCALALFGAPNNLIIFTALLVALGLVQSANFAVVPELNHDEASRAKTLGAMAMMGNAGNLLGTPILLAMIGLFGDHGLALFLVLAYSGGVGVYAFAWRRRPS